MHEALARQRDAFRRERRCRGDGVRWTASGPLASAQKLRRERAAKLLAASGFGRRFAEVWLTKQRPKHAIQHSPPSGKPSIAVILLPEEPGRQRVDHHVAGAG